MWEALLPKGLSCSSVHRTGHVRAQRCAVLLHCYHKLNAVLRHMGVKPARKQIHASFHLAVGFLVETFCHPESACPPEASSVASFSHLTLEPLNPNPYPNRRSPA